MHVGKVFIPADSGVNELTVRTPRRTRAEVFIPADSGVNELSFLKRAGD